MAKVTGLAAEVTAKKLSAEGKETLRKDLENVVNEEKSPKIASLIRKYAGDVRSLVERVNDNTKQGYEGLEAGGSSLVAQWITPGDFGKATWDRGTRASGSASFISGTTSEEEGFIIFAWMDQQSKPPVNKVKLHKGTEDSMVEPLAFRAREKFNDSETPIVEQRRPLIIEPETDYEVEDYAPVSGTDSLQPLGFYVKTASAAESF